MVQREDLIKSYPRILVISPAPFSLHTGAGVTFTNLFKGWPVERIAMIYGDKADRDESVCRNFYALSEKELIWSWFFQPMQKSLSKRRSGNAARHHFGGKRKISTVKKLLLFLFRFLIGDEFPKRFNLSSDMEDWIKKFNPEVIYSAVAKSVVYVDLTLEISRRFRLPVVTHIMDDWQSIKYRAGLFGPCLRQRLKKRLKELLDVSYKRMGICDLMCLAYKVRYGLEFTPFLNAIDISDWKPKIRKDRSSSRPFKIMYHGSIYHGSIVARACSQINGLVDICKASERLNSCGMDVEVFIHTPPAIANYYRRYFKRFPRVFIESNFVPVEEIPRFLSEKDLLVLPVTFDKKGSQLLRYSMSTKVPEFMMSGAPVLLYGPDNTAPIQYAMKEGWGYVVTERKLDILKNAIKKLIEDQALREELSKRAQEVACLNHDSNKVSKEFHDILKGVMN